MGMYSKVDVFVLPIDDTSRGTKEPSVEETRCVSSRRRRPAEGTTRPSLNSANGSMRGNASRSVSWRQCDSSHC